MQEKKNKSLLISLLALLVLIAFFSWRSRTNETLEIDKDVFLLEDYKSIDRVTLESGGSKVELKFNGTRWKVNDQYNADRNMVSVLFATLQQVRAKRKLSPNRKDSLQQVIVQQGVHVSLFAGQSLRQEFTASGNESKTQAWFFNPDDKESYVMEIPGYRVYASGIFELDENGWRDKYVFNFNWRNFSGLQVKFPNKPAENFNVGITKDFFGIEGMEADTAKLNTFLDNVSLLTVDGYSNNASLRDSLLQIGPQMEIVVKDIANKEYVLSIFSSENANVPGLVPDNQLAHFNVRKIQTIVRPRSFFRKR